MAVCRRRLGARRYRRLRAVRRRSPTAHSIHGAGRGTADPRREPGSNQRVAQQRRRSDGFGHRRGARPRRRDLHRRSPADRSDPVDRGNGARVAWRGSAASGTRVEHDRVRPNHQKLPGDAHTTGVEREAAHSNPAVLDESGLGESIGNDLGRLEVLDHDERALHPRAGRAHGHGVAAQDPSSPLASRDTQTAFVRRALRRPRARARRWRRRRFSSVQRREHPARLTRRVAAIALRSTERAIELVVRDVRPMG